MTKSIGIYAGAFNPIHAGHLSFALEAIKKAGLEQVVFLPERRPRYKPDIEHFGHRTAMITRAIKPYSKLSLLELSDIHFDIARTLPKLLQEFKGYRLNLLIGSDVVPGLKQWPDIEDLLASCDLTIGLRHGDQPVKMIEELNKLSAKVNCQIIETGAPEISSRRVREALSQNSKAPGLLKSVQIYAQKQWLYSSLQAGSVSSE